MERYRDPNIGDQYLFLTIAAVIVSGTSLVGAIGDYWRTVLWSLILIALTTILVGHSFGASTQQILRRRDPRRRGHLRARPPTAGPRLTRAKKTRTTSKKEQNGCAGW
ncbi:MAG: hypothetical protein J2P19_31105 [Pseudonocardia sp.]|nr:hypothetical protein [Pseudonocardia sp.]